MRLLRMADAMTEIKTSPASLDFTVEGMTCGSCATRIQRILGRQPGVESAIVNYATSQARVLRADHPANPAAPRAAVERIGYRLAPGEAAPPLATGGGEAASAGAGWARVIVGVALASAVG